MSVNLSFLQRVPGAGRLLRALGVSGVPTAGYFGAGWPIGTMLVLYWIETVLITLSVAVLARRHREMTGDPGHQGRGHELSLKDVLRALVVFNLFHGLFIAGYAFVAFPRILGPSTEVSASSLVLGALAITLCLVAALAFDLRNLAERSYRWVERHASYAGRRMVVTHLTLIFGAGLVVNTERPLTFLAVFIGLKAVADLVAILAERRGEGGRPRPEAGG